MLCEIPAVFAVENTYQIAVQRKEKAVMWVKVGNRCFLTIPTEFSNRTQTFIKSLSLPSFWRIAEVIPCAAEICLTESRIFPKQAK